MSEKCKNCGSRIMKVFDFSNNSIQVYYKCESCECETKHIWYKRDGVLFDKLMRRELGEF